MSDIRQAARRTTGELRDVVKGGEAYLGFRERERV